MVKVFAPALSLDASGTIGNAMTFSRWKGRNYIRERVIPANPRSSAQWGVRSMMRFLSQQWASISPLDQAAWDELADAQAISRFNAYVQNNMLGWRNFMPPTQRYPAARTGTPAPITASVATALGNLINVTLTLDAGADQWGAIIFVASASGLTPGRSNARFIDAAPASQATGFQFGPFEPGTYYLRYHTFSTDGKFDTTYDTEDQVVIG